MNDASLTTLGDTTLTLDGTGTIALGQITSIFNGTINTSGGTPAFSNLSNVSGSNIDVSGGTLSLPLVRTTYNGDGNNTTLQANGAGAILSLANLKLHYSQPGLLRQQPRVGCLAARSTCLRFTQISTSGIFVESAGSESVLNIPLLTSFVATSGSSTLQDTSSGTLNAPLLVSLAGTTLDDRRHGYDGHRSRSPALSMAASTPAAALPPSVICRMSAARISTSAAAH